MDRRRAYVDSSIILRRLLGQPGALRGLSRWLLLASELVGVKALRVLHRLHSTGDLSDDRLGLRIAELQALMTAVSWRRAAKPSSAAASSSLGCSGPSAAPMR